MCDQFYIFTSVDFCGLEYHDNVRIPRSKTKTYLTLSKYLVLANSGILPQPCVAGQHKDNDTITFSFWLERFSPFKAAFWGEAWR